MASVGPPGSIVVPIAGTNQHGTNIQRRYKSGCVLGLSITQLVIGILCIIAHIFLFLLFSPLMFVGHGIWTGIIFIITGSFGIASSCSKTKCTVVTFLVMSIISAVVTIGLIIPSATDWGIGDNISYYASYPRAHYASYPRARYDLVYIYPAAIMVFLAVLEAVIAIVSSGFACHAVCCGDNQQQTPAVAGQVQYVVGPNGQQQAVIVPVGQQHQGYMPAAPPYHAPAALPSTGAPQHGPPVSGAPPPK